jgi:ATP diphosphatase
MTPSRDISRLLEIMARLRDPQKGCPWDLAQDFQSIAPHTLEETYEVLDAIARDDRTDLQDELGDLLLQIVFYAQMANEAGDFDFGAVVEGITAKLIRRHPHIFADTHAATADDVKMAWDQIKAQEKREKIEIKTQERARRGLPALSVDLSQTRFLDTVRAHLPALQRAYQLTSRAAQVGFDWPNAREVIAKIHEELEECESALASQQKDAIEDEIGDVMFALVNLARHAGVDPERALTRTNHKFITRFGFIEETLHAQGRTLDSASLEDMEALWQKAKNV